MAWLRSSHNEAHGGTHVSPAAIITWITFGFLILPVLIVIPMSFGSSQYIAFPPSDFSVTFYKRFLGASDWLNALVMSVQVAMSATIISLVVGVPAAYGLVRGRFRGQKLLTMALFTPLLVPVVVLALGLYFYFSNLKILGSEWTLIFSHSAFVLPFVLVTSMSGLRHIDPNLEIAAKVMGASEFTSFMRVTVPLLRPSIIGGGIFAFLMSFDEIVIAYFITQSSEQTLPVKMFSSIQWNLTPMISVVATILMLLSVAVCLVGAFTTERR